MLIIHTFNVLYCCVCIFDEYLKKCFLLLCIFKNFNDTFFQIFNYSGVNNSIKGRQKELIENSNKEAHILKRWRFEFYYIKTLDLVFCYK